MKCKKCNHDINKNAFYCPYCGNKIKNQDNIAIIVITSIILGGIGLVVFFFIALIGIRYSNSRKAISERNKYEEYIEYVENLSCNINQKNYPCDLKGKYTVIKDDSKGKTGIITFKINNTDITFNVISSVKCISELSYPCSQKKILYLATIILAFLII